MSLELCVLAVTVVCSGGLIVASPLPIRVRDELSPAEVGFLRRGARVAVRTAVVGLHADGWLVARRPGLLARGTTPMRAGGDPLARAVYAAVATPTRSGALRGRPRVRQALAGVARKLSTSALAPGRGRWFVARLATAVVVAVSLVRLSQVESSSTSVAPYAVMLVAAASVWLLPRRTLAGYRYLARLRRVHAQLLSEVCSSHDAAADLSPEQVAMAYGLRGIVAPGAEAVLARGRFGRSADDYPTELDHGGAWKSGGWGSGV